MIKTSFLLSFVWLSKTEIIVYIFKQLFVGLYVNRAATNDYYDSRLVADYFCD